MQKYMDSFQTDGQTKLNIAEPISTVKDEYVAISSGFHTPSHNLNRLSIRNFHPEQMQDVIADRRVE